MGDPVVQEPIAIDNGLCRYSGIHLYPVDTLYALVSPQIVDSRLPLLLEGFKTSNWKQIAKYLA